VRSGAAASRTTRETSTRVNHALVLRDAMRCIAPQDEVLGLIG
jgi:hypothetical protein